MQNLAERLPAVSILLTTLLLLGNRFLAVATSLPPRRAAQARRVWSMEQCELALLGAAGAVVLSEMIWISFYGLNAAMLHFVWIAGVLYAFSVFIASRARIRVEQWREEYLAMRLLRERTGVPVRGAFEDGLAYLTKHDSAGACRMARMVVLEYARARGAISSSGTLDELFVEPRPQLPADVEGLIVALSAAFPDEKVRYLLSSEPAFMSAGRPIDAQAFLRVLWEELVDRESTLPVLRSEESDPSTVAPYPT